MQILIDFNGCPYTAIAVIQNNEIIKITQLPQTTIKLVCRS